MSRRIPCQKIILFLESRDLVVKHVVVSGEPMQKENRLFAGIRYAFTSYKVDITRKDLVDPVWQYMTDFGEEGIKCNMHWFEVVFGIDAKIFGPMHLGWNVRYKRRIAHKEGDIGLSWYVPGFGINDQDTFGADFRVIIDI